MRLRSPGSPTARAVALALVMAGALLMVGAVFADQLNLSDAFGRRQGEGFGWKQLIVAIVGLVLVLGGLAWLVQPVPVGEFDEPMDAGE